jgi:hypothetical protein
MLRDVTPIPKALSSNFTISSTPFKCHVTLKSLLHQELVKKIVKVIVVGFAIKRERAAVLKEHAKLQWEHMEHVKGGDSSFTFKNVLPLNRQALPWQSAPKKVNKYVSEGLQVISSSKF